MEVVFLHSVHLKISAYTFSEDIFDALFRELASSRQSSDSRSWITQGDTVNPFGDVRAVISTVYTFDLPNDTLLFSDPNQNQKLPFQAFSRLREGIMPTITDFTPFETRLPLELNSSAFHTPYWDPTIKVSQRNLTLIGRLLSDFNFQWRHILRRAYAECTFQRLARAVLDIGTLDFNIVMESEPVFERQREYYISGNKFPEKEHYVSNNSFPIWEPREYKLFSLGQIVVVLEQDLEHALALIPGDAARRYDSAKTKSGIREKRRRADVYLLLSLRHVMLCHIDHKNIPSYTRPIPFMNGIDNPSSAAIIVILQALTFAFTPPLHTRIHNLPMELQDQILEHAGEGHLESARLGCLLGLGSPFNWMRAKDSSRAQGPIERHVAWSPRDYVSPVEYEIHLGKIFSGVAYK